MVSARQENDFLEESLARHLLRTYRETDKACRAWKKKHSDKDVEKVKKNIETELDKKDMAVHRALSVINRVTTIEEIENDFGYNEKKRVEYFIARIKAR